MSLVTGGLLVARALKCHGVQQIYGLIGYQLSAIFAGCASERLKVVDTRHEQAAIHMADGYAQLTGKPGVAVVIGGPGIANSVAGIVKAYLAQTPMVVITGASDPRKRDAGGLQDLDQLTFLRQYTKWCATVFDTARIPEYIAKAFRHAMQGRRGPTLLEIPINYLRGEVEEEEVVWPVNLSAESRTYGDPLRIREAIELLLQAERPICLAGNGVFYSKGEAALAAFIEASGVPLLTINAGRGTVPDDHELCFGLGKVLDAGPQLYAFQHADLLLVVGSSLDYAVFGAKPPLFNKSQKVIQVDLNPADIGLSGKPIDVAITGHSDAVLGQLLEQLATASPGAGSNRYQGWIGTLSEQAGRYWSNLEKDYSPDQFPIHPMRLLKDLQHTLPNAITILDGSNAMLWAGLMLKCNLPGHQVVGPNGTFGPMGTGLPVALGAKTASPDKVVILYTGDGSFGFNIMEINTAIRHGIAVLIVVHNDAAWGFCRDTQRTIFGRENSDYCTDLGMVRYDQVVQALGGYGELVEHPDQIVPALGRALASGQVACLNVVVDPDQMSPGAKFMNKLVKTIM